MNARPVVDGPGPVSRKQVPAAPWAVLAVLATAQFLVVLTTSIVNVALPSIGRGLGLGPAGLAWVVNAYVLAFGALLLLGGRLGDVLGRRPVFLAGTAVFTAGSVMAGLADGAVLLVAARGVQGLGAALLAPTALGLLLSLFPPGAGRARAISVWGAVSGAGGAAGVLLSGALTDAFGWRSVFLAVVPVAVLVLAATPPLVPADVPAGGRIDVAGAALVTGGLVAVTLGLSSGGDHGWTSARTLGPLLGGTLVLLVFAVLQTRIREPLVRPRILRTGAVTAANLLMMLLGAAWLGLFFFLPLYQQKVLGYSPIRAGLTQLPLALSITGASALTPRAVRVLGPRVLLAASFGLMAAGLWWLSLAPVDGTFAPAIAGPSLPTGIGMGVAFVLLTELSATGVPGADAGLAGGLVNTSRQIGGAIGLAALTAVSAAAGATSPAGARTSVPALARGYGAALAAAALIAAAAALLSLLAHPRKEDRA